MTVVPIEAVGAVAPAQLDLAGAAMAAPPPRATSFEALLNGGIEAVDQKLQEANAAAAAFAVDDSIPVHQVMFALEDARLNFELMLQIRSRLVEGYQEILRMQL
jgi:flagellar hook-basal body complex protein FliE